MILQKPNLRRTGTVNAGTAQQQQSGKAETRMFSLDSEGVRSWKLAKYIYINIQFYLNLWTVKHSEINDSNLPIFPGIFWDIPQNVWKHSPECLRSFPTMLGNIPRNI